MYNARTIHYLLLCLLPCIISCNKPDKGGNDIPTPSEPTPEITIPSSQDTTPVFTDKGGETSVSFQSSAPWTVDVINTKVVSWCKVSPMSGPAGSAKISIKTDPNDTYNERQASVQIKSGSVTKTIVVTQKQQDNITVSITKFELPSEGGSVKVELKSNIDYKYEIDPACKDWIRYETTKAYESSSLMFAVAANETLDKREGKITVSGGAFSEDVHIYQAGENPTLVLTRNEYDVPAEGGEVNVEVQSNVAVTMSIPSGCTWVYEDKTKSMSSCSFKLAVEANEALEAREATITFTNAENNLSETVKIRQSGKEFVPVSSVALDKESVEMKVAETVTLTATVNPSDATDKTVTWSTSDASVATVENGVVTAMKIGTATITAKAGDKTATCAITVTAIDSDNNIGDLDLEELN